MKFKFTLTIAVSAVALTGCWQLHEQESVRPHEEPAMPPPADSVAVNDLDEPLVNPFNPADEQVVYEGHLNYRRYCWQCHGSDLTGTGGESAIAGQAFPHLNRSLLDASIQDQTDAEIFEAINSWSGEEKRSCPPMGATMLDEEIWETVNYLRAVAAGDAETGVPEGYRYGAIPAHQARLSRYGGAPTVADEPEVVLHMIEDHPVEEPAEAH